MAIHRLPAYLIKFEEMW